jgi:hypothetical protein
MNLKERAYVQSSIIIKIHQDELILLVIGLDSLEFVDYKNVVNALYIQ